MKKAVPKTLPVGRVAPRSAFYASIHVLPVCNWQKRTEFRTCEVFSRRIGIEGAGLPVANRRHVRRSGRLAQSALSFTHADFDAFVENCFAKRTRVCVYSSQAWKKTTTGRYV